MEAQGLENNYMRVLMQKEHKQAVVAAKQVVVVIMAVVDVVQKFRYLYLYVRLMQESLHTNALTICTSVQSFMFTDVVVTRPSKVSRFIDALY